MNGNEVARALADLADQLFAMTSADIEAGTHEQVAGRHR
ncbi:MAG: DUF1876 domain-containing protein [Mycobacterium sp.]|nr:dsRBD fold-containing protein [Mycobacterium sp.]TAM67238.1 MAG: DUF1876 domain-containing protein [Mycobacterium sp.]